MNNSLILVSNTLPIGVDGLQSYLRRVNAVPLLNEEEEQILARRFREEGDLLAAQQLVLSHLRFVVRIAKTYSGYGLGLADLIQEGTIGLMKAVKRFDPKVGVRLVTFAVHWIKSEIHEFVIRNWRIVKIATTKAQRKLFFNLRQAKKRLGWFSQEEVQGVAEELGVSPKEVLEMENRLNAQDYSFEYNDTEEEGVFHFTHLPAPRESEPSYVMDCETAKTQTSGALQQALASLDPRSFDIVSRRWLKEVKASLKELAEEYGVSIERIRQLEKAAMKKLHGMLQPQE